jgi:FkbM family methyltransferase
MTEMLLRMTDGSHIVVPASLDAMTTYVILEQETWFEKEMAFVARWLRPGMTAIDIGANLGVYALPMARLVGPGGRVFAYEPASETARLLSISRARNGAVNLQVIAAALSDSEREGHLVLGISSELNALDGHGRGKPFRSPRSTRNKKSAVGARSTFSRSMPKARKSAFWRGPNRFSPTAHRS